MSLSIIVTASILLPPPVSAGQPAPPSCVQRSLRVVTSLLCLCAWSWIPCCMARSPGEVPTVITHHPERTVAKPHSSESVLSSTTLWDMPLTPSIKSRVSTASKGTMLHLKLQEVARVYLKRHSRNCGREEWCPHLKEGTIRFPRGDASATCASVKPHRWIERG